MAVAPTGIPAAAVLRSRLPLGEEVRHVGIPSEASAEVPKRAEAVFEATGGVLGIEPVDEMASERLVLPVRCKVGLEAAIEVVVHAIMKFKDIAGTLLHQPRAAIFNSTATGNSLHSAVYCEEIRV